MTKNILITRVKERSSDMIKVLEKKGFNVFCESLFLVEKFVEKKEFNLVDFAIITSANAAYFLAQSNLRKDTKIYAVGRKTFQALEGLGFTNISHPKKSNAIALRKLILKKEKSKNGLYFHGPIMSLDFRQELGRLGFTIENILSYKTLENKSFSADLLKFCQNKNFAQVFIFSKNSAQIFLRLAKIHNLLEYFKKSEIIVTSKEALALLEHSGFSSLKLFTSLPISKDFYD